MADIVFRYVEMRQAAENIRTLASNYQKTGETFVTEFTSAISNWEGDTKDAIQKFITGSVSEFTSVTIPDLLNALATLLDENANQMEEADRQIAANIPTSLGGE